MFEWLFGREDTAESLTREVNSFFDRFRRLQTRIEALVSANKEAKDKECKLNIDTREGFSTTLTNAVERAHKVYNEDYAEEQGRHDESILKLTAEMQALSGSLRLATKVVNFAEEE